jgi:hypothetical protein
MRSGAIAAPGRPLARAGKTRLPPAPATPGPGARGTTPPPSQSARVLPGPAPSRYRGLPPACEPVP